MRRVWRSHANAWGERERQARAGYDQATRPQLDRLDAAIARVDQRLDELSGEAERHRQWEVQHPEAAGRLASLDAQLRLLDQDRELQRGVEPVAGVDPPRPHITRGIDHRRGLGL